MGQIAKKRACVSCFSLFFALPLGTTFTDTGGHASGDVEHAAVAQPAGVPDAPALAQ